MGAVFLATDQSLANEVAVKINRSDSPKAAAQFIAEARLLATLRHPNLPRVIDYFQEDNMGQFLVMDYIAGKDLKALLEQHEVPSVGQVLEWAEQLGAALSYLHRQNPPIFHRDVKPANLKLTAHNEIILVDFGIAKAAAASQDTATGASLLSPGYAPPEQYGVGHTGAYSDQYAMGATFYQLLTGQLPADAFQRLMGKASLVPVQYLNPNVPPHVDQALQRAMALRVEDRFGSVDEFVQAMKQPGANPGYGPTIPAGGYPPTLASNYVPPAQFPYAPAQPNLPPSQPPYPPTLASGYGVPAQPQAKFPTSQPPNLPPSQPPYPQPGYPPPSQPPFQQPGYLPPSQPPFQQPPLASGYAVPSQPTYAPPPPQPKPFPWLWAGITGLVVLVVAIGAVLAMGGGDSPTPTPTLAATVRPTTAATPTTLPATPTAVLKTTAPTAAASATPGPTATAARTATSAPTVAVSTATLVAGAPLQNPAGFVAKYFTIFAARPNGFSSTDWSVKLTSGAKVTSKDGFLNVLGAVDATSNEVTFENNIRIFLGGGTYGIGLTDFTLYVQRSADWTNYLRMSCTDVGKPGAMLLHCQWYAQIASKETRLENTAGDLCTGICDIEVELDGGNIRVYARKELKISFKNTQLSTGGIALHVTNPTQTPFTLDKVSVYEIPKGSTLGKSLLLDDLGEEWPVGHSDNEFATIDRSIAGETYTWVVKSKQDVITRVNPTPEYVLPVRFALYVDVQQLSGPNDAAYGLVFRYQDPDNYYYFCATDNGTISVYVKQNGKWSTLVDEMDASTDIIPGLSNGLAVKGDGPVYSFYVNDTMITKITDDRFKNGSFGLAAELYSAAQQATWEYTLVQVNALP